MVLEDKLAETAPKKPLALTLGAAAVTLAVIIGVLAGPSVVSCFNSEDGMGACLGGKMTDAGILPRQAVASTDAATPAAEPVAIVSPAPEADTAVGNPALDVTPPAPAAKAPEGLIAATFGLLRAEPDGRVVIAGSGTPGSEIEIYSDDNLLGTATVEPSGDWVFVPDAPIVPGGTEITLAEAGKPGRAAQSFVVVINDDKSTEPLVVASTPGTASEVLQGLDRPAIDTATQMAAADPVTPPAPASTATATPTPAATPAPVAPPAPKPAAPAVTAAQTPPAAPIPEAPPPSAPAATSTAPTSTPPATTPPQPAATPSTTATAPIVTPPAAPAITPATPTAVPTPAPAAPAVAAVDPAPTAQTAPAAPVAIAIAPTIDAIEIEGDRTFFAGAGSEGATIRLYVDDSFIADSIVEDGRWLIEGSNVLTKPNQRVRIDMLEAGNAEVAARAEVNFEVELPADTAPTAVAEADPAPAIAPAASAASTETPATASTTEAASAPTAADTPATEPVPTLVAVSVGGPDSERFASGKAIIRRGDNLWTIARRVYGEGIRYTTIYEANTGQIRDPDRIYPGQVFELPN
ncbi:LysM peptidoglycan-binding domain-containing protein [Devosia psychrophila]|uniref:Nucleoid-associated protein YgaU, contains BON and LysM domains n=1 Tax=Devosia psychrophila TaxID=728005 RepID=A0A1I1IYX9_9HYPH|nr:LysM peptidoglycan-binding domain-containing protein [Devosia psychrophila]SFC41464.1 Nucleoid-associated protein YgaU, contains BON and LysM domains [Devosia psychrophila]